MHTEISTEWKTKKLKLIFVAWIHFIENGAETENLKELNLLSKN